jgi:hypothetical protein
VGTDRRDLWLVFLVALAVRLAFALVAYPHVEPSFRTPDGYDAIAANLAAGRGFRLEGSSLAAAERLPLYPTLLAASYLAFGPSPLRGRSRSACSARSPASSSCSSRAAGRAAPARWR